MRFVPVCSFLRNIATACRVGKGESTAFHDGRDPRTPCPRILECCASIHDAWARRTRVVAIEKCRAGAFAHPTRPRFVEFKRKSKRLRKAPLETWIGMGYT